MSAKRRYVYAVLGERDARAARTGDPSLRLARAGKLVAATAIVDRTPAIDEDALRAHDRVVRELCTRCLAVLPVRFGTMFHDEASLRQLLTRSSRALVKALRLVSGREQMTVRFLGHPPALPRVAAPAGSGPGTRHLLARKLAYSDTTVPEADPVRALVASLVVAERAERVPPPTVRSRKLAPIATVYHLISRGQAAEYRAALAKIARIVVSGPFPAYAFAPEILP